MSATTSPSTALDVVRAFADAYAAGDAARVAGLLADDVHEREVTPGAIVDQRGPAAVLAEVDEFLAPFGTPEIVEHVVEPFGPLVAWCTCWRLRSGDETWLVRWHAFATVREGRIAKLDIVCSGRVPDA